MTDMALEIALVLAWVSILSADTLDDSVGDSEVTGVCTLLIFWAGVSVMTHPWLRLVLQSERESPVKVVILWPLV